MLSRKNKVCFQILICNKLLRIPIIITTDTVAFVLIVIISIKILLITWMCSHFKSTFHLTYIVRCSIYSSCTIYLIYLSNNTICIFSCVCLVFQETKSMNLYHTQCWEHAWFVGHEPGPACVFWLLCGPASFQFPLSRLIYIFIFFLSFFKTKVIKKMYASEASEKMLMFVNIFTKKTKYGIQHLNWQKQIK